MDILITGGAGFIGASLAERLLRDGHGVIILDNLSTGSYTNIHHLHSFEHFSFYEGTIIDYRLMRTLVTACDRIFHLAAAVGVKFVVEHPLESLITNVRGTEIMLELAATYRKKIFIASSSEVYGKSGAGAFKETDDRVLGSAHIPRWGYSCSKAIDEFLAMAYYHTRQLPLVVGRLFNVCGPRQVPQYGMVIPRFVTQALANQPVTVFGDGTQVRSFTYVDDVVSAMIALMNEPRAEGEIVNIGSPAPINMNELARLICRLANSTSPIVRVPYDQAYEKGFEDMLYRLPDITKLTQLTGFAPAVSLPDMLQLIINAHRGKP